MKESWLMPALFGAWLLGFLGGGFFGFFVPRAIKRLMAS